MNAKDKAKILHAALERLVELLKRDPGNRWSAKFENDLTASKALIDGTFSQDVATKLSQSIVSVFGGMGSFNDYSPSVYNAATGRYVAIPGCDDFGEVTTRVHDAAIGLRTLE